MICPRCGSPNADTAAECGECHHKFQFGHAFGDPSKMTYFDVTSGAASSVSRKSRSTRLALIISVVLLFSLFCLAIIKSFIH